jgi:hypothetical protein
MGAVFVRDFSSGRDLEVVPGHKSAGFFLLLSVLFDYAR